MTSLCPNRSLRWVAVLLAATLHTALAQGPFGGDDSGIPGTSTLFRAWISGVESLAKPTGSGGYARNTAGAPCSPEEAVVGFPGGFNLDDQESPFHVLSLGNGGELVVSFDVAIANRPGPDFAVFENGFSDETRFGDTDYTFAELAFVEVGTTTSAWARFPSTYLGTQLVYNLNDDVNAWYASQDVTLIDGLAGKHALAYGTPFDLAALADHPRVLDGSVDLNYIRYVKLIDVIGNGSTVDSEGRPIYDPYFSSLTGGEPFGSVFDGFDLRGVGILHIAGAAMILDQGRPGITWYGEAGSTYQVYRTQGQIPAGPPRAGTNGWETFLDASPPLPTAWYHVEVVP